MGRSWPELWKKYKKHPLEISRWPNHIRSLEKKMSYMWKMRMVGKNHWITTLGLNKNSIPWTLKCKHNSQIKSDALQHLKQKLLLPWTWNWWSHVWTCWEDETTGSYHNKLYQMERKYRVHNQKIPYTGDTESLDSCG